jgi:pimeloyl-ACP methyl ester carboxylesterase
MILEGGEVSLYYEVRGTGPTVVLLHPYPSDHSFWLPIVPMLEERFRLVLPDLRGLGRSGVGEGPSTMAQIAQDVLRLCEALNIGRAAFVGCSVGGYALFELWRQARERIKALALLDTRAGMDNDEGRLARLKNAEEILERGTEWAVEQMLPRLLSPRTLQSRSDVVEQVKATMRHAGAAGLAALQRGMAQRPDSLPTLASITVPTLVLGGEDDLPTPPSELEILARGIPGAELKIIARAGHLAAMEQPEEVGRLLRDFLEHSAR